MNKGILFGGAVILALAAGIGVYMSNGTPDEAVMMEKQQMEQAAMDDAKMEMEKAAMEKDAMEQSQMMGDEVMQKDVMQKEGSMMKEDAMTNESAGSTMMSAGTYEPYAPAKIATASASHDVVLFFRASWCPTCKAVDADIKARLKDIPAHLTILDVNYDDSADLKKKYGVTYQHTFVQVDAQGNLVKKWSGSPTLAALISEVK